MKAYGRSLSDFEPLFKLEQKLLEGCRKGTVAQGELRCPEEASQENTVRAGFLRFLLLGGDNRVVVHEHGVQLRGAYIQGVLELRSTTVDCLFSAVFCNFEKAPVFRNADLKRSLTLNGSHMKGFLGAGMAVTGDVELRKIKASGTVFLDRAVISGQVHCSGASLEEAVGYSLSAIGANIGGGVFLVDGFKAQGQVRLLNANIEGQFNCRAGQFLCEGQSINAGGIKVGGGTFLTEGFKSLGEVIFIAATIKRQMTLQGAHLESKNEITLRADGVVIEGSLLLNKNFTSLGTVSLRGGEIHGQLNCGGAVFSGTQKNALSADYLNVKGSANLDSGFSSESRVSFVSALIEGDFSLFKAARIPRLSASQMQVKGSLIIRELAEPLGSISLASARVAALNDDARSWGENLVINGFVYGFLDVHNTMSVKGRVSWLEKQRARLPGSTNKKPSKLPVFLPQPWKQLKHVLDAMGRAEDAREIGIEYERHRYTCGQVGLTPDTWSPVRRWVSSVIAKALHCCYGKLIGYGYRPMQLVPWFLGVWLITTIIYWGAANHGAVFAPSDPLVFQNPAYAACRPPADKSLQAAPGTGNWYLCDALPQEYTGFSPIAFSLDLLLPLVDLHQEKDWAPLIETPKSNVADELMGFWSAKRLVRFTMWFEILAGWVFSLLFVVIVSGLARGKEQQV